ncbi:MAG: rane protein [Betaproteobacteria bacterium]|nr:rane protein [Betaproteobacteria bacterium]
MVLHLEESTTPGFSIVRQYSSSAAQRASLCAVTSIAVLMVGALFLAAGAWPVLAFSVAAVGAVIHYWIEIERHRDDEEVVALKVQTVEIAVRRRELRERYNFQRYWAKPVWSDDGKRLMIRSHGREVEIGVGLSKLDKLLVFRYLRKTLGNHAPMGMSAA